MNLKTYFLIQKGKFLIQSAKNRSDLPIRYKYFKGKKLTPLWF